MKGSPSKEVIFEKVDVCMGYPTFVISKVSLTKKVVFQEGGLSEGVQLLCFRCNEIHCTLQFLHAITRWSRDCHFVHCY